MIEYPLKGVKIYEINTLADERDFFAPALREEWKELLENEWINKQKSAMRAPS